MQDLKITIGNNAIEERLFKLISGHAPISVHLLLIAPDKDWRQMGIYPPLFDLIGYFKFKLGI